MLVRACMLDVDRSLTSEECGRKVALMYGQMNEPPGALGVRGLTGLTVTEYFRDKHTEV